MCSARPKLYAPAGQLLEGEISGGGMHVGLAYERDAKGRPRSLTTQDAVKRAVVSGIQFDASDRPLEMAFGNGTYARFEFDPRSEHLRSIAYEDSSRATMGSVTYTYDPHGNPLSEERKGPSETVSPKVHTYDALDRLASSSWTVQGVTTSETYGYSPGGTLLRAGTESYGYENATQPQAATRLSGAEGLRRALVYDADGSLRGDIRSDVGGPFDERTLSYSPEGCLTSVEARKRIVGSTARVSETTRYVCDASGHTVVRSTELASGERVARLNLGELGEVHPDEGVFVLRLSVGGTVAVEEAHALSDGSLVPSKSGYLHKDVRGSVLATTTYEAPGTDKRAEAEYGPWGETLAVSSLPAPRHGFADADHDPGLGYHHFGVRTYDPSLRRWLSPDPLLFAAPHVYQYVGDQLNLYQYAGNNPVSHRDTSGAILETLWDIANVVMDIRAILSWTNRTSLRDRAVDVLSMVADTGSVLLPGVPGGAGAAGKVIKGAEKAAEAAVDAAKATKTADKAADTARVAREVEKGVEGARTARGAATHEATGFLGSKRAPFANAPSQPLRNADAVIDGRTYGGHALDQMQNRGLVPSVVEDTIQNGVKTPDPIAGGLRFFDAQNNVTVITEGERVVTVIPGKR